MLVESGTNTIYQVLRNFKIKSDIKMNSNNEAN